MMAQMVMIWRWLGGLLLLASGILGVLVKPAFVTFSVGPRGIFVDGSTATLCLVLGCGALGYSVYLRRRLKRTTKK
ncbi:hypothetical protein LZ22198_MCBDPFMK_00260 [Levilactobacillus zymae]